MLALFLGTAALPHILIRYYTVPSPAAARKSTIVAIAAIGVLLHPHPVHGPRRHDQRHRSTSRTTTCPRRCWRGRSATFLFAMISAIAFATVLGTVSGLIIAASGAVAHDLLDRFAGIIKNDKQKVTVGQDRGLRGRRHRHPPRASSSRASTCRSWSAWPSRWPPRPTCPHRHDAVLEEDDRQGHHRLDHRGHRLLDRPHPRSRRRCTSSTASIPPRRRIPLKNPGIVSIPLSFLTLVLVSLLTQKSGKANQEADG